MALSLFLEVSVDEQEFAWFTGKRFDGLTISRKPRGWSAHVKATTSGGAPVYAYSFSGDLPSLLQWLSTFYGTREGTRQWRPDKYR